MKKLFVAILPSLLAVSAIAQEGKTGKESKQNYPEGIKREQNITPQMLGEKEYYVFKDKKLYHVKDNLSDEVTADVFMSNGTKLTVKGEIIYRSGKHEALEEGQCIDMTATVSFCQAPPEKKPEPEKKQEQPEKISPYKEPKKVEPGK